MTVSAKTRLVRTINFLFTQHYWQCPRNGSPKFQPSVVCSFEIIALDSWKSKIIDLYSDYTENKLQALTLAVITFVLISLQRCNLALNVYHGSAHQPRYSVCLVGTCAYGYESGLVEEMITISLRLPHRKQTHVTRILLKLQKRRKDFRTLHEQAI